MAGRSKSPRRSTRKSHSKRKSTRKSPRRSHAKRRSTRKSPKRVAAGYSKITGGACGKWKEEDCGRTDPNCHWIRGRGCSSRRKTVTGGIRYEGPAAKPVHTYSYY